MLKVDPKPVVLSSSSETHNNATSNQQSNGKSKSKSNSSSSNSNSSNISWIRWIVLELPLWILLTVWAATQFGHALYTGPIQTLVESFRRTEGVDNLGYYRDFIPDMTYYGRQCDARDVSTGSSNDLIVPTTATPDDAADTMMQHGAVLIRNLLSNETAQELRAYLETRHDIKDRLPWHEKFWGDIGRLSLGLGVDDHPIIAQALQEVGTNQVLRTTLEGIVGPDPAIVEISTLTTLHGAQVQGIHTDSDYFGSSLLYSRTFLHSYTLFMALQDTTSKMGATTVCPGTQWCANEDMADICLPPSYFEYNDHNDDEDDGENGQSSPKRHRHAFEVSSNGQTGRNVGLLYQGDGMMFNQNIWHRGPRNHDKEHIMNRVMFIVTFVSRQAHDENDVHPNGDVRQQGLGTYYYQRWNMWGHTFEDLKHAATRMRQPLAALKALGLWKLPYYYQNTHWGIPWLEHFARQLANDEDFFASYELPDFLGFLDNRLGVPRWLQGRKPKKIVGDDEGALSDKKGRRRRSKRQDEEEEEDLEWESFLLQFSTNLKELMDTIHWMALAWYVIINTIAIAVTQRGAGGFVKRALFKYIVTAVLWFGLWHYVTQVSYLGKRIQMRDTWRQPFSEVTSLDHLQRTTFPTREDVLVGSRFDAPYLSSFNHVLDYHPGNRAFQTALNKFGTTAGSSSLLLQAYMNQPAQGVTRRFLQQDWRTGYWSLMTNEERNGYLARQVYSQHHSPLTGLLDEHLKTVLADARFGRRRETVMAQTFTPQFVTDWQAVLYRNMPAAWNATQTITAATCTTTTTAKPSTKNAILSTPKTLSTLPTTRLSSSSLFLIDVKTPSTIIFTTANGSLRLVRQGDRVLAPYFETGQYWEASMGLGVVDDEDQAVVDFALTMGELGASHVVPKTAIRPFASVVQGDLAHVEYQEGQDDWRLVEILPIHPLGHATIRYLEAEGIPEDEWIEEGIPMESIRMILPSPGTPGDAASASASASASILVDTPAYEVQPRDRVLARFGGRGQWFPGRIDQIHPEDGTYAVTYDDGDYEDRKPAHHIKLFVPPGMSPTAKRKMRRGTMSTPMKKKTKPQFKPSTSTDRATGPSVSSSSQHQEPQEGGPDALATPSLGDGDIDYGEESSQFQSGQEVLIYLEGESKDDDDDDDDESDENETGWFPATIVAVHENGSYDLDVSGDDDEEEDLVLNVRVDRLRHLPNDDDEKEEEGEDGDDDSEHTTD